MTYRDFLESLINEKPSPSLSPLLKSLWYDGNGKWDKAHDLAAGITTPDGSWVHAYLHRKEGDLSNASYWYSLAGKKTPSISLHEEWEGIVRSLLTSH